MRNQKGFAGVEGLLILIIVGLMAGAGWFVWKSSNDANKSLDNANNSSSVTTKTASKKTATAKPTADPTADWVSYSSTKGQFSLRYPNTWVQPTNKDLCSAGLFDRTLYVGPDAQSVLKCATEFFGQMSVGSVDGDKRSDYDLGTGYKNVTKQDVTINGVTGQKISGTAGTAAADAVFAPIEGTTEVHYVFYTKGMTYEARYTQAPKGRSPSTDVLSDFDLMVTKTLKFSS